MISGLKDTVKPLLTGAIVTMGICTLLVLLYGGTSEEGHSSPSAEMGILDATNWAFQQNLKLQGQWEYYQEEFIPPEEFRDNDSKENIYYREFPGSFAAKDIHGNITSLKTYGTARLKISLPQQHANKLAIELPDVTSAWKLWVNGELVAAMHNPASSAASEVPGRMLGYASLPPAENYEFVMWVSNFNMPSPLVFKVPYLYQQNDITNKMRWTTALNYLALGIAAIMVLYHVVLFTIRPKEIVYLVFIICTLVLAFRVMSISHQILLDIFPEISQITIWRFEYFTFYIFPPFITVFYALVYPKECHFRLSVPLFVVGGGLAITTLVAQPSVFAAPVALWQLVTLLFIVLLVGINYRTMQLNRDGARIGFFFLVIAYAFTLNDLLRAIGIIDTPELLMLTMICYVMTQAMILAVRFSKTFESLEDLSQELTRLNNDLEEKVGVRTKDLAEKSASLEKNNKQIRRILEENPIAVIVLSSDYHFLFWNERVATLLGVPVKNLENRHISVFSEQISNYDEVVEKLAIDSQITNMELCIHSGDRQVWILLNTRRTEFEEKSALICWLYEITDRKKAEQDKLQAAKIASLGQLVKGVAHEINTPVGTTLTAVSHLDEEAKSIQQALESNTLKKNQLVQFVSNTLSATKIMQISTERTAQLIQTFKQVAADQTYAKKQIFTLDNFLEELSTSLNILLKPTPHQLHIESVKDIQMHSYATIMQQVFTELVKNAIVHGFQHFGDNQGDITIQIEQYDKNWLSIEFLDNGEGINSEIADKVFEPFVTTKRGDGYSGLGLHLVFNLVTVQLGGKIRLENEVNSGTVFTLMLPLHAPDNDTTESSSIMN